MEKFDVFVIGTGVAGTAVANACAHQGLKVGITDEREFGGTCSLRGCVPKKVLVGATEVVENAGQLLGKGIAKIPAINWDSLLAFKNSFVDEKPKNKEKSFKENGIATYHGTATFLAVNQLRIGDESVEAEKIVIANGATTRDLGIDGKEHALDSEDFLQLKNLPETMLFIGGGYIAFEFAHIAARCGVKVKIVNNLPNVLHNFEQDIVKHLVEASIALGIEIISETEVTEIFKTGDGYAVMGEKDGEKSQFNTQMVINSSGRVPAVDGLQLENGKVRYSPKGVKVNRFLQSVTNPNVYAAGDVAASESLPLTPLATLEAQVVSANILGRNHTEADYSVMPTVVFTLPTMAAVGMTEKQATEKNLDFKVNYKWVPEWFTAKHINAGHYAFKVIVENNSGKILGAHLIGPQAGETINLFALAIKTGIAASELAKIPFAFPTAAADVSSMV